MKSGVLAGTIGALGLVMIACTMSPVPPDSEGEQPFLRVAYLSSELPHSVSFAAMASQPPGKVALADPASVAHALPGTAVQCLYNPADAREFVCESETGGNSGIFLINPELGLQSTVIDTPQPETQPELSPDGTRVVYAGDQDGDGRFEIHIIGRDGLAPALLVDDFDPASGHTLDNRDPTWSPDGQTILFASRRSDADASVEQGDYEIKAVPVAGGPTEVLTDDASDDRDPAWHPDGNIFFFANQQHGYFQIYASALHGSSPHDDRRAKRMTHSKVDERCPTVSPGGDLLAWITRDKVKGDNRDGSHEVAVARLRGRALARQILLTQNPNGVVLSCPDFESARDTTAPTVVQVIPTDGATGVALDQVIQATFSEAMDPATLTSASFLLTDPDGLEVTGSLAYDATSETLLFAPDEDLAELTEYTATITTAATDEAGNPLAADFVWTFTTGGAGAEAIIDLASAADFAVLAGSTITNTGLTVITGDVGLTPGSSVTGFPPGVIDGGLFINDALGVAVQAKEDLLAAYDAAVALETAPILVAGNLGGLTLAPGLYKSTSTLEISSGDLTLDAQGDANALFIFQMATTLTVTTDRKMILAGGAQADNVFWQVGSSATLGVNSVIKGTVMADQSITVASGAEVEGRVFAITGAVTMDTNAITVP